MKVDKAVKLAIKNIIREKLDDIFDPPHELEQLKDPEFQDIIFRETVKAINSNSLDGLAINPIDHVLMPKGQAYDFRRCALIQPIDSIKYLALAICMAQEIEAARPPKNKKLVFSYRFAPKDGLIFAENYNITAFRKHTSEKQAEKRTKILVSCDISNFYDRLNLHRLEMILNSYVKDSGKVGMLNQLLLFWANRDSYGLPVGNNASRILAEAALLEVDNYLISINARFARFVDDYRFFAPDAHTAHYWLTQLIERLWLEGLTINKSKTKIEDVSNFKKTEKKEVNRKKTTETSEKKEQPFRIIAGYGGTIPTKFREMPEREIENLKKEDPKAKYSEIMDSAIPSPESIVSFVKSIVASKQFEMFKFMPEVSSVFPQFTPYIVDSLVKHSSLIPVNEREIIRNKYSKRLKDDLHIPEYIMISLVKLLGSEEFADKETLLTFFRNLKRNAGALIGRILLESLEKHLLRGEVLEIRKYFVRADQWEKREIIRIVTKHLREEEARPWLKNIRIGESRDLFLVDMIKDNRKVRKKQTKKRPSY